MGAWRAYYKALVDAGVYVGGAPLEPPSAGATVRVHDGQRRVQDGPYADTKEQLGGQIVIDVPSLDEALDWAARCPSAASGGDRGQAGVPHGALARHRWAGADDPRLVVEYVARESYGRLVAYLSARTA